MGYAKLKYESTKLVHECQDTIFLCVAFIVLYTKKIIATAPKGYNSLQ